MAAVRPSGVTMGTDLNDAVGKEKGRFRSSRDPTHRFIIDPRPWNASVPMVAMLFSCNHLFAPPKHANGVTYITIYHVRRAFIY